MWRAGSALLLLAAVASGCASTSAQGTPAAPTDAASTTVSSGTSVPVGVTTTVAPSTLPPTTLPPTTTVPPTTTLPLPSAIVPDVLPDVVEAAALGPQPDGPNARRAAGDRPDVYDNGCHVAWNVVQPKKDCIYGDPTADTVIAVVGDSHAAAWVGAFDEAGKAHHWKIVMVTKSGCPAARVTIYSAADPTKHNVPYTQCDEWRPNALAYVNNLQPDMVVLPLLSRRSVVGLPGALGLQAWERGLGETIDTVRSTGAKVLVVGEVPKMKGDSVPACIAAHRSDISACANARSAAVKSDRMIPLGGVAVEHGATFIDVSNWFCTDTICPAVIGGIVVFRDEHHITDTFARYRAPQMAEAIEAAFATR
jgi:hypothetical protein